MKISDGKTESNNSCRDIDEQKSKPIGDCPSSHTCVFESRGSSTITCATSSPLFHCKLLAEPHEPELYSYHNEKVVPIRDVETHE
ncbi:unnamed protein product [Lasius platythorax]|uniref:Uncharacterized protein n=1 Tax=Lasius platythorax TaxID=488582 RepID=A0AAV2P9F9_9HYME